MAVLQILTSGSPPTPKSVTKTTVAEKSTEDREQIPHIDYPISATDALDDTITMNQERWIDFCAVGGMLVKEDGSIKPTTVGEFAFELGVTRQTLYYWKKSIPEFKERVRIRLRELGGDSERLAKAWNGIFLKTAAGNAEAGKLYFANFDPEFKMPTQKVENELNGMGLAELMELAQRRRLENATEGEVIPQKAIDASNSQ